MAITQSLLTLVISFATVASGHVAELPQSAESLLLKTLNARKLLEVHEVRHRTANGFDYLGVFATFEVDSGFEKWYQPEVILRKRHNDADWSNADLFRSRKRIIDLFALPDVEFQKALIHGKTIRA
jgi:hypothetical protein